MCSPFFYDAHVGKITFCVCLSLTCPLPRLAEDDKEGVISDKVLQVLWLLITARDTSTDIIDIALSTHIKILNYVYSHG